MIISKMKTMLKSLKLLKKYREIFLDVTIEEHEDIVDKLYKVIGENDG